jgi:Fe-S cluster assembly protein SufD
LAEPANSAKTTETGIGWLVDRRSAHLQRFRDTGLPAPFEEDWQGTDLRAFGLDRDAATAALGGRLDSPAPVLERGDGFAHLLPLEEAHRLRPDVLMAHHLAGFDPETAPPLAALNAACGTTGALLHVPRDSTMEQPARIEWHLAGDGLSFQRSLAVLEQGSRGSLVERFHTAGTACAVSEVVVGPGASLDLLTIVDGDGAGFCFQGVARVAAGGRLRWYLGTVGGRMVRVDMDVTLEGAGADSRIIGFGVGRDGRHLDHRTVQRHAAPDTRSNIVFGTLLRERCRSIYRGLIGMDTNARNGDAGQQNHNLLLESGPVAEAIPKLEILTDDVKCSHGSTVGRISEEELFFATARGIPEARAREMVAEGLIRRTLADGGEWTGLADELFGAVRRAVSETAGRERSENDD